jgi:hypothetical protein
MGQIGYLEFFTDVSGQPLSFWRDRQVTPNFLQTFRDKLSALLMGPIGYPEFLTDVSEQPFCPFDGTDRLSRISYRCFGTTSALLVGQIGYPELQMFRNNLSALLMGPIGYPEFLSDVSGQPLCPFGGTDRLFRIYYRRLGTTCSSFFMGPIGYPETSVINYHYSLRNNTEERSSHPLRGCGLK